MTPTDYAQRISELTRLALADGCPPEAMVTVLAEQLVAGASTLPMRPRVAKRHLDTLIKDFSSEPMAPHVLSAWLSPGSGDAG